MRGVSLFGVSLLLDLGCGTVCGSESFGSIGKGGRWVCCRCESFVGSVGDQPFLAFNPRRVRACVTREPRQAHPWECERVYEPNNPGFTGPWDSQSQPFLVPNHPRKVQACVVTREPRQPSLGA